MPALFKLFYILAFKCFAVNHFSVEKQKIFVIIGVLLLITLVSRSKDFFRETWLQLYVIDKLIIWKNVNQILLQSQEKYITLNYRRLLKHYQKFHIHSKITCSINECCKKLSNVRAKTIFGGIILYFPQNISFNKTKSLNNNSDNNGGSDDESLSVTLIGLTFAR